MRKTQHNKGFTMAEMLIVVAIIVVLAGFAFVGISRYQRSLHQLEMDGIAKEIFVAAQNHLAMADSQGLLKADTAASPNPAGTNEANDIYYYIVDVDGYPVDGGRRALDLMLPFASVDETVRLGGSYIIRYQLPKEKLQAKVLDVFYATKTGRFAHAFNTGDYSTLVSNYIGDTHKQDRRKYTDGSVIGWYGGEEANNLPRGAELKVPTIEVINAERLLVKVTNPNVDEPGKTDYANAGLRLVITGKTSGKKKAIDLIGSNGVITDKSGFTVVLDDVTSATDHFLQVTENQLIPGEDITVQAICYNNNALTNIAYSSEVKTNSLFASLEPPVAPSTTYTANIANFRHLENLSNAVSSFNPTFGSAENQITIKTAKQIADMDWNQFKSAIVAEKQKKNSEYKNINVFYGENAIAKNDCYLPVDLPPNSTGNPANNFVYDGVGHKIMNVQVDHDGPAGIFGTLNNSNLSNVLVYNTKEDNNPEISGQGPVGGLVGVMNGGTIDRCGAAVYVKATAGDAGGLVGKTTGTVTIQDSFVGGHTFEGRYEEHTEDRKVNTNVVSTGGNAGGLIGNGDGTLTVKNCYSTASAKGGTSVGGLIGKVNGGEVSNCYATGLVAGANDSTSKGAFIGSATGSQNMTGNSYFSIVNYSVEDGDLKPVGGKDTSTGITPFDQDASTYDAFVKIQKDASPYDETLKTSYQGKYALKTVSDLAGYTPPAAGTVPPDWMSKHYGDWPSMETLVINEKNAPATP